MTFHRQTRYFKENVDISWKIFTFKKKVLCCNWVDKTEFPSDGICVLNSKKYEDFEERVLEILKMSYLDYLEKIKDINLTYNTSIDTLKFLRAELK